MTIATEVQPATQARAIASQANGKKTIQALLQGEQFKLAVQQVLPKHLPADRFIRIAIAAMTRTPKLAQCEPHSFFGALMNLSQMGLEPDGRRAHLIPFENKKRKVVECQLIVDYKGLAELAMRSGQIASLHADVVRENDDFEWNMGDITRHKVDWRKPRGNAYCAYARAVTKDGAVFCEVMTSDEIISIRNSSSGWHAFTQGWSKQSPWDPKNEVSEKEMWKKTVFRRLSKWLPLSPEYRDALDSVDSDSAKLEAQRFEASRPVFDTPKQLFEAPAEETEASTEEDEVPMTFPQSSPPPSSAAGAEPNQPEAVSTPSLAEQPPASSEPVKEKGHINLVKAVTHLLQMGGFSEVELIQFLHDSGKLPEGGPATIREMDKVAQETLREVCDNFSWYGQELKRVRAQGVKKV